MPNIDISNPGDSANALTAALEALVQYDLGDLLDVSITAPANGHYLSYDSTSNTWVNIAKPALDDLTDVDATTPSNGAILTYDNANSTWYTKRPTIAIAFYCDQTPTANATMLEYVSVNDFVLPTNLTGSAAYAATPPSADTTFTIKKNGTSIGSFTFPNATAAATFSFVADVVFTSADRIEIITPDNLNGVAQFGVTFKGTITV